MKTKLFWISLGAGIEGLVHIVWQGGIDVQCFV